MRNVAIIGAGPAGFTAAIYTARAELAPILFTGQQPGGQLTTTTEVENFPGFPAGITGPELMAALEQQATRFGTEVRMGCTVTALAPIPGGIRVAWDDLINGGAATDGFRAVIIATGASAKRLHAPGEDDFFNGRGTHHGVTACATCDGAMPIYRNQPVAVIGGGDTACEEALFMTRYAAKVFLVHRRGELRASRIMAHRVSTHPKIQLVWHRTVAGYLTDDAHHLRGVVLADPRSGATEELAVRGVFLAIGHTPNTGFLAGSGVELDPADYIRVMGGSRTSVPRIYAAGDVRDATYRQAVTAAGMGCMAAIEVERFLQEG
jgi:thioredoxin reductase (NADPH)